MACRKKGSGRVYAVPSFAALLQFIARLIFAKKNPAPNQGRVDFGLPAPGIGSGLTPVVAKARVLA